MREQQCRTQGWRTAVIVLHGDTAGGFRTKSSTTDPPVGELEAVWGIRPWVFRVPATFSEFDLIREVAAAVKKGYEV